MKRPLPGTLYPKSLIGRFIALTAILVVVLSVVTMVVHNTFESHKLTFLQSVFFVIETMTTTGYGELLPFESQIMTVYSTVLMVFGLGFVFFVFGTVASEWLRTRFRSRPPRQVSERLSDHVVICGSTPLTNTIVARLDERGIPYVVVSEDVEVVDALIEQNVRAVFGDPSGEETLLGCGVARARAVISDGSDADNANVALQVRSIAEGVPVIVTLHERGHEHKLRYAGATRVVSPKRVLGQELVRWVLSDLPRSIVSATKDFEELQLVDIPVGASRNLAGQTLRQTRIRSLTGATVIGLWKAGFFHLVSSADDVLDSDAIMTAIGTKSQLDRLSRFVSGSRLVKERESGHVVIAGYGEVGRHVTSGLIEAGQECRVVDLMRLEEHLQTAASTQHWVTGDATEEDVLVEAGIQTASTFIVALNRDADAIFSVLIARQLNPDVRILVRANGVQAKNRLYKAGADSVLSLSEVGGNMFIRALLDDDNPQLPDQDIQFVEFPAERRLVSKTIAESDIYRRTGCLVIAVGRAGSVIANLVSTFELMRGDSLLVLGDSSSLRRFAETYGLEMPDSLTTSNMQS